MQIRVVVVVKYICWLDNVMVAMNAVTWGKTTAP